MTADPTTLSLADLAAAVVLLGARRGAGDSRVLVNSAEGRVTVADAVDYDDIDLLLAAANRLPGVVEERNHLADTLGDCGIALANCAKERDAAIQRAATAEGKLRETTYAALAARGQAEADTVAGIANYVRRRDPAQVPYPDLCASIADRIESYAWRGKEQA